MKKCAIIRGDNLRVCPFGLSIPNACKYAGQAMHRMAPVEDTKDENKKQSIIKANNLIYVYYKSEKPCPFADKVLEDHGKVDCNFTDTAQGFKSSNFVGSPLYPQTFHGIGLDGLYGFPLGFYADNNESRNLFFGLFSFLGSATTEELVKLAHEYDASKEYEKANILDKLLSELSDINEEHPEAFKKIEEYLAEYRKKYEANRADTGLLWELSDAWFGPRQVNR